MTNIIDKYIWQDPYFYTRNSDGSLGKMLSPTAPENIVIYFARSIEEDIEVADNELKLIRDSRLQKHWRDYKSMLIKLLNSLDSRMNPDKALTTVLKLAHQDRVQYKVADNDIKVEFVSGKAEAYRVSIQKLMLRIERGLLQGKCSLSASTQQLFERSPFAFDNATSDGFSSMNQMMFGKNPNIRLPQRKSFRSVSIGQELSWD